MSGRKHRPAARRLHLERLEPRSMLAGIAPKSWGAVNRSLTDDAAGESSQWTVRLNAAALEEWGTFEGVCQNLPRETGNAVEVVRGLGDPGLVLVRSKGKNIQEQAGKIKELVTPKLPLKQRVRVYAPERSIDSDSTADDKAITTTTPVTSDEDATKQWGMSKIDVGEAWKKAGRGDRTAVVAVIDTGVDLNHPDLRDNIWRNDNESDNKADSDNIDNDGNDYVDDVNGWDFVDDDNDPADEHFHGTHVAGIIAASADNMPAGETAAIGISGIAPGVKILPLRVFDENGQGLVSDVIRSLYYCVDLRFQGVNIVAINNSYSWPDLGSELRRGDIGVPEDMIAEFEKGARQIEEEAVAAVTAADMAFVAAAGNDGRDIDAPKNPQQYPAAIAPSVDAVIAVAASSAAESRLPASNWGAKSVDLFAPGEAIWSLLPVGKYAALSGSSMATAFVSGAVALVRSANRDLSATAAKEVVMNTVTKVRAFEGYVASGGRLNVSLAIQNAMKIQATPAIPCFYLPADKRLDIRGTNGDDKVQVTQTSQDLLVVKVTSGMGKSDERSYSLATQPIGRIFFTGGPGNDTFNNGTAIRSQAFGGPGNDTLSGGSNRDLLSGGIGDDKLVGRGDQDRLDGGPGTDILTGGRGADVFIGTKDEIKDFNGSVSDGDSMETPATASDRPRSIPRRPLSLAVVPNSPTEVQVSWEERGGAASYRLRYRDAQAAGAWSYFTVGQTTQKTLQGLTPGSSYAIDVRAENGKGASPWRFGSFKTPLMTGPLAAPGRPELISRTTDGFRIRWQDNSVGETSFLVDVWTQTKGWQAVEKVIGKTECTVEGLDPGTLYSVRVSALGGKPSPPSQVQSIATASVTSRSLAAPGGLTVADIGDRSVTLRWLDRSTQPQEDGFEVWVAQADDVFRLSERVPANGTTAMIEQVRRDGPPLAPLTNYSFKVRAYRNLGANVSFSDFTVPVAAKTLDDHPAAPSGLKFDGAGATFVELSWQNGSSPPRANGFEVWVAKAGGAFGLSEKVPQNATAARIEKERLDGPSLTAPNSYAFKVRAYRQVGATVLFSDFTPAISRTLTDVPLAPTGLTVGSIGKQSFRLAWNHDGANLTGFEIEVRRLGSTAWNLAEPVPDGKRSAVVDWEKYSTRTELRSQTTYDVRIRARNDGKASPWSEVVRLKTS